MQRKRKYILFVVINNIKWIKHYIISRFSKLRYMKEMQEVCEFDEKLIIN